MDSVNSKIPVVARLFLGLVFTVFGLNGFLQFLPMPPLSGPGGAFMGALAATGYMFPLIKGTEVVVGLLLLSGRFVPLALVLLAPVSVNIVLFHGLLSPGLGLPLVIVGAQLLLAYAYRDHYAPLLTSKAAPRTASVRPPHAEPIAAR